MEAALLLPALMLCIALLVQPACLLYTRCVMQAAAAEGCRVVSTRPTSVNRDESTLRNFVLRRLAAVPDAPVFRAGPWQVEVEGGSSDGTVRVKVSTVVRPLPLVGVVPALLGQTDGAGDVVLEVEVVRATRPGWVEGSYGDWTGIWD